MKRYIIATGGGSIYKPESSVYFELQCGREKQRAHPDNCEKKCSVQNQQFCDAPSEANCDMKKEVPKTSKKKTKIKSIRRIGLYGRVHDASKHLKKLFLTRHYRMENKSASSKYAE